MNRLIKLARAHGACNDGLATLLGANTPREAWLSASHEHRRWFLDRVCKPALAEYDRVCKPAQAEYDRVCKPAWAEYARVRDAAQAEYDRVRDAAQAACDSV